MDLVEFENALILEGYREYTIECHLRQLKRLLNDCKPLSENSVRQLLLVKLREGKKAASLNRLLITLRHYGRIHKIDWAATFPLLKSTEEPHKEIFSDEEIEQIIALPCPLRFRKNIWDRWTVWLMVLAFSGMRASEVSTLTVSQVDWASNNFILPKTKTTPRRVPIASILKEPLKEHMQDKSWYVFPVPSKRGHVWRQGWQKHMNVRLKILGISRPGLTTHSFRHSFITNLFEEGASLPDIMNIAGHKDPKTTLQYSHLGNRSAQKSINRHRIIKKHADPREILEDFVHEAQQRGLLNPENFSWKITDDSVSIAIRKKE